MTDIEILKQKEQLYEEYRNKIKELEETREHSSELRSKLDDSHRKIERLEDEVRKIHNLIDYMIRNNLDPVEAKLKYNNKGHSTTFHHPVYMTVTPHLDLYQDKDYYDIEDYYQEL